MTLRMPIAAFALTAGLTGVPSQAEAQVTVTPGIGGVTFGSGSAGLYVPYSGGGAQFFHPSTGAWNYSNGTISPAYSSFYSPYSNFGYGGLANNGYYSPYNTWGNNTAWGNTYSSYYAPYGNWGGWTYPSTSYYYPSGSYYYPTWGSNYYANPGRVRGLFRR